MPMIGVSACLLGQPCRYDGRANRVDALALLAESGEAIALCPECMGGLPTPREPAEIEHGFSGADVLDGKARVLTKGGADVTDCYVRGAYAALACMRAHGAAEAILKARSPSCGSGTIYDGMFSGTLTSGDGVTAALFKREGIAVRTEETL